MFTISKEILESIMREARQETCCDDEEFYESGVEPWVGDHVDDAYDKGVRDGYALFARGLLNDLGITWETN